MKSPLDRPETGDETLKARALFARVGGLARHGGGVQLNDLTLPETRAARALLTAVAAAGFVAAAGGAGVAKGAAARTNAIALFAGLGGVDLELAVAEGEGVEHGDGLLRLGLGAHGNKSEPLGLSGITIFDDVDGGDRAGLGEQRAQVFFSGRIVEVAHI